MDVYFISWNLQTGSRLAQRKKLGSLEEQDYGAKESNKTDTQSLEKQLKEKEYKNPPHFLGGKKPAKWSKRDVNRSGIPQIIIMTGSRGDYVTQRRRRRRSGGRLRIFLGD